MSAHLFSWVAVCFLMCLADCSFAATGKLVLVVGAPGGEEYERAFSEQAEGWESVGKQAGWDVLKIGLDPTSTNDLALLKEVVTGLESTNDHPSWLVFIGHGSFDGKAARFNLRGPDLVAGQLAEWLKSVKTPMVIVNTASSSAPFLNQLSGTNRLIVTATRSGHEQNYTRFGKFMAQAMQSLEADLDKDDQVSLLEAFLSASRRTAEFYKVEGRIATEHALIDDNGDGLGTPAEWYVGMRPAKKPQDNKAGVDGLFARQQHVLVSKADSKLTPEQTRRRDELERAVLELREKKGQLAELEYYAQIERHLLELARLYQDAEKQQSR